jgi:hypothetical protein
MLDRDADLLAVSYALEVAKVAEGKKAAPSVIPEATLLLEEGGTAIERERSRIPALPGQMIALSACRPVVTVVLRWPTAGVQKPITVFRINAI